MDLQYIAFGLQIIQSGFTIGYATYSYRLSRKFQAKGILLWNELIAILGMIITVAVNIIEQQDDLIVNLTLGIPVISVIFLPIIYDRAMSRTLMLIQLISNFSAFWFTKFQLLTAVQVTIFAYILTFAALIEYKELIQDEWIVPYLSFYLQKHQVKQFITQQSILEYVTPQAKASVQDSGVSLDRPGYMASEVSLTQTDTGALKQGLLRGMMQSEQSLSELYIPTRLQVKFTGVYSKQGQKDQMYFEIKYASKTTDSLYTSRTLEEFNNLFQKLELDYHPINVQLFKPTELAIKLKSRLVEVVKRQLSPEQAYELGRFFQDTATLRKYE